MDAAQHWIITSYIIIIYINLTNEFNYSSMRVWWKEDVSYFWKIIWIYEVVRVYNVPSRFWQWKSGFGFCDILHNFAAFETYFWMSSKAMNIDLSNICRICRFDFIFCRCWPFVVGIWSWYVAAGIGYQSTACCITTPLYEQHTVIFCIKKF